MPVTLHGAPTKNFVSTSLNGAIDDSTTTITLNSTTNLPTVGFLVINRQDANAANTPDAREEVKYTGISGSDVTGVTRAADGSTARSHADGSLVEPALTVGMWNDQQTYLDVAHDSDGTILPISTATIATLRNTNLTGSTASITTLDVVNLNITTEPNKIAGQFLWSRSGTLATVLNATATHSHFPVQRATKELTINSAFLSVLSAPSTDVLDFDISWASGATGDFTSIFSTRPFVDIGEYSTLSSATPGTLTLTSLASGIVLRAEVRKTGEAGGLTAQLQVESR